MNWVIQNEKNKIGISVFVLVIGTGICNISFGQKDSMIVNGKKVEIYSAE